jgi:hypothetical protein
MLTGTHLSPEFLCRVHRRIDLAPEDRLGVPERLHDLPEGDSSHDHQIDVAVVPHITPCGRAIDEG